VIAGTGTCSTAQSLELTLRASQAGADACLLVTPYYNKPTQTGLYEHYRTIAQAAAQTSDIPLLLYNVPSRTACDLLPETVARLAELEGIVGIKEAVPEMGRIRALVAAVGDDFAVISGDDPTALESMFNGARGVISVTANVAPGAMHRLCASALAGDREGAEAENSRLEPLHAVMFLESNPIPVKWALEAMGLIPGGLRLPLTRLDASHHEVLREALTRADVLVTT
jgi:4-hydroxy-tetrahydrodipicolinate synthase